MSATDERRKGFDYVSKEVCDLNTKHNYAMLTRIETSISNAVTVMNNNNEKHREDIKELFGKVEDKTNKEDLSTHSKCNSHINVATITVALFLLAIVIPVFMQIFKVLAETS